MSRAVMAMEAMSRGDAEMLPRAVMAMVGKDVQGAMARTVATGNGRLDNEC